jgi:hypothetical protein
MRQRKKVSGIGDVLLHFTIFLANLSRNWFRRAIFNALLAGSPCRKVPRRCIIRPCREMNKGTKWADLPDPRG